MQSTISRYTPSGAFSPAIALYTLGGLLGAILLAGLYELLLRIPFVYISVMLTMGFGFALGTVGILVVKAGHCRNRAVALAVGLLVGAGGLAASYGWGFRHALAEVAERHPETSVLQLAQQVSIQKWLDVRIESGWSIRSSSIDGVGVLLIWGIEALFVLGASLFLSFGAACEPYCERCRVWTKEQKGGVPGRERADVQPLLDRGDLAGVLALEAGSENSNVRIRLQRDFCPQCPETAYLTVSEVRTTVKNGKLEETATELLGYAELSPRLNTQYTQRFEQQQQPVAPVAGAAS